MIVELVPESQPPVIGLFAGQVAHTAESVADLSEAELRLLLRYLRERTAASREEADRLRRVGRPHATRRRTVLTCGACYVDRYARRW